MSAIENILGMLPDRIGDGKNSQIYTPPHIAQEMVNALPEDIWNKDTTFLDICCKSGIFLYKIYQKLMESKSMVEVFPDETDRATHIVHKQLFGIAPNLFCQMFSTRTVYGYLDPESHIISFGDNYNHVMQNQDKRFLLDTLQKEFNMKKFGVVIGNPPYNNDAYLDFVTLGHKLADKYTMMITPAKWQAKGGAKNEDFRREIVPYMSDITYYPVAFDVFDILEPDGISYYLLDKVEYKEKNITNISNTFDVFNSTIDQKIVNEKFTLLNCAESVINKTFENKKIHFNINDFSKKYRVVAVTKAPGMTHAKNKNTPIFITSILTIRDDYVGNESDRISVFSTDNLDEAKSFVSFMYTRLARFLFYCTVCKLTGVYNDYDWRFVPAPEAFDHIFTDAELYKKYNLTEEEINIIESVIKERK